MRNSEPAERNGTERSRTALRPEEAGRGRTREIEERVIKRALGVKGAGEGEGEATAVAVAVAAVGGKRGRETDQIEWRTVLQRDREKSNKSSGFIGHRRCNPIGA